MTAQEYLKLHGINEESVKRFHLVAENGHLNIPIKNKEDKIIWVKKRNLDFNPDDPDSKKYINQTGTKAALFNIRSHQDKPSLVLTEGEIDAIRLDQEGIPAISSTAGAGSFNAELAEDLKDKDIYIIYDNDEAGKQGIRKVLEFLPNAKITELPLDSHDVCDFFTLHTRKEFIDVLKGSMTKEEWDIKYQKPDYRTHTLTELLKREYPPEAWIIDKFLPTEGIVLFSGDAGVGKSFLTLEIIRAMVDNDIFLDHFEIKTSNVPVLLIDKENGSRRLQKRIRGLGIPPTDYIHFLDYPEKFSLEDKDFLESVQNFIIANKIGIVIVDSLIDILVGEENSSTDTAAVFNKLREIAPNIVWVILHHEAKPVAHFSKAIIDRARGSSNIKAQVDYLFSLQRTKAPKVINIEQGKARDYELLAPFSVEFMTIEETEEMGGFKYIGEVKSEVTALVEAMDQAYLFIQDSPGCSKADIEVALLQFNISPRTVKDALNNLEKKNLIDSFKRPGHRNTKFYNVLGMSVNFEDIQTDTDVDTDVDLGS